MDRKILAIMGALVLVAVVVVAYVLVASGGLQSGRDFTNLFNKLTYSGDNTYQQQLELPSGWHVGDKKVVSDTIVDMRYDVGSIGSTSVYITTLWFNYMGNKWNDPHRGTYFYVPDDSHDGWLIVDHGRFSIQVSSATNLSAKYDIGDDITLETLLVTNDNVVLAFGEWVVASTL